VNQVFDIAVTDASFAASNSLLSGSVHPGDLVIVGVVTPQAFFVASEGPHHSHEQLLVARQT